MYLPEQVNVETLGKIKLALNNRMVLLFSRTNTLPSMFRNVHNESFMGLDLEGVDYLLHVRTNSLFLLNRGLGIVVSFI